MIFGVIGGLQKQASRVPTIPFSEWFGTLITRDIALEWAGVGVVSVVLGVCTLIAASLPLQWPIFFVLAALCPLVVILIGDVRKLLLGIIIIEIPIQLDVYLYYQEDAAALGALGGLNLSITTLCLAILYILWLAELLAKQATLRPALIRMCLPAATYLAAVGLSITVAHNVDLAIFEIFLLLQTFLLYVYIVNSVRTRQDVLFLVTMLLINLIVVSLIIFGVSLVGHSIRFAGIWVRINAGRPAGTLGGSNIAASYIGLLLTPALSVLLTPARQLYKRLAAVAFGLGGIALFLTLSRGGSFAFIIAVTLFVLLVWHRGWLSLKIPFAISIVAVLVFLISLEALLDRVLQASTSALSRIPLMKLALLIIEDRPFLGVGANNFGIVVEQYVPVGLSGEWIYTVHNKYLLVWAEAGLGALTAFIWFLGATIHRGWQCWQRRDRLLSPLALGFTAALVGHMLHMNIDIFNSRPQVQLLWLIAGLITAMYRIDEGTDDKAAN